MRVSFSKYARLGPIVFEVCSYSRQRIGPDSCVIRLFGSEYMRRVTTLITTILLAIAAQAQSIVEEPRQDSSLPPSPPQQQAQTIEQAEWQWDALGQDESFGMLSAYDPNLLQATSFGLGFVRYRTRGYSFRTVDQRLGGLSLRDPLRDIPAWGATAGLSQTGLPVSYEPLAVSLQVTDRNIHAYEQQRGGKLSVSTSNRTSYLLRAGASYSSGELANGWAYSLYASHSGGRAYSMPGVWNNNWAAYGSVSKRLGGGHHLSLTLLAAPTERATRSASTAEAYELRGDNLYNPAWGEWQGQQRSARSQRSFQPIAMLTHNYRSDRLVVNTTLAGRLGSDSRSDLNWQNAPNPRPDYYRYMPSFQIDNHLREQITELWRTDDRSVTQIDFSELTSINSYNAPRAHYIIESRHRTYGEFQLQSSATIRTSERTKIMAGIEAVYSNTLNFKRLDDLLGASYWLDIDSFAENEEDTRNKTQNNMRDPNRHVAVGDDFGYRFSLESFAPRAWLGLTHRRSRWDFALGATAGARIFSRVGHYEKQNFEGRSSLGRSAWFTAPEWMARGGVGYSLGGRFRAGVSLSAGEMSPSPSNSFVDIEYRNAMVADLRNEQILSGELTLDYRLPWLRLYGAAFYTEFRNRTEVRHFYDDFSHFFCDYTLTGIDTRHMGIELSAEVELVPQLWLRLSGVLSDNRYTSDPIAREQRQSTGDELTTERVYFSALHVEGSPQAVAVAEIEYSPRQWTFSLALNSFSGSYIAPTPLRRTLRTADQMRSPEELGDMTRQERFAGGATVDLFAGRTIYLRGNQRLGFYLGVNNLLNRRDIRTGGYESSRVRFTGSDPNRTLRPLDSKYYYAQGINFYFTATYRF